VVLVEGYFFHVTKGLRGQMTPEERRETSTGRKSGKRRLVETFWPAIVDEGTARKAARYGAAICGYSAVASLVVAFAGFGYVEPDFEKYGLIASSTIYAVLGLGILRMWLPAAIMALLLFAGDFLVSLLHSGGKPVWSLILLVFFISGVRGTHYYQKHVPANGKQRSINR
jgi:hypothetical protein